MSSIEPPRHHQTRMGVRAGVVIDLYALGAEADAVHEGNRHTRLRRQQMDVQVQRSLVVAWRLRKPGLLVLNDPVGTGKTVVALAAARLLIGGVPRQTGHVRRVLIVAPNQEVARVWRTRAAWAGLTVDVPNCEALVRTVRELHDLGGVGLPRSRGDLLVIVDEAHRGLHSTGTIVYEALRQVTRGARVLLVTATPFQMTGSGLETMLEVDGQTERGDNIREFAGAVATWLRGQHQNVVAGSKQGDLRHLRLEVQRTMDVARDDLETVLMPPYPHKAMSRPAWIETPSHPLRVDLGDWAYAYHAARALPELIDADGEQRVQNTDSYMRMLVSSSAAWRASHVYRAASERSGPLKGLLSAIEDSTRRGPGGHPKVAATADASLRALRQGSHVLIFCVFIATKSELAEAINTRLKAHEAVEVTVADDLAGAKRALRGGFGQPPSGAHPASVLIVSDKLSESVDLDGGRPTVIHHDLSWSPVRWEQRMGRVIRASTGFQLPRGVIVPILRVDVDERLWQTLKGRRHLTDHVVGARRQRLEEAIVSVDVDNVSE